MKVPKNLQKRDTRKARKNKHTTYSLVLQDQNSFMANVFSLGITKELTIRTIIITIIFSIISYAVIYKNSSTPEQLAISMPLLFVIFGIVMLIGILFCIRKYHAINAA